MQQRFHCSPSGRNETLAVTSSSSHYKAGEAATINYTNAPAFAKDWIGIYKVGTTPGTGSYTQWAYVSGASGAKTFSNLPKGYYFANYFIKDGYTELGQRTFFSVGDTITNLTTDKTIYNLGEYITATWTDGAGIVKDWLGLYHSGDNPNVDPLVGYTYFGGVPNGSKTITSDTVLPKKPGKYFIVMFTNDSYNEISNRVYFTLVAPSKTLSETTTGIKESIEENDEVKIYPNPASTNGNSIIESKYPIDRLEFLDGLGRVVYQSNNVNSNNFSLVTIDLPPGIYYVRVYQDNRKMNVYKLVVNK